MRMWRGTTTRWMTMKTTARIEHRARACAAYAPRVQTNASVHALGSIGSRQWMAYPIGPLECKGPTERPTYCRARASRQGGG